MTTSERASEPTKLTFHDPAEVRLRRKRAGLSQRQLANKAKITAAHLCNIELGKTEASPPVLQRIAKALGCRVIDIERRDAEKKPA
ncbi:MAG TPA: helix-turn-helix transcriptional regulator [Lacunisphaera sp.]